MISGNAALTGSYDLTQVALSVLIAISASYAALDLAGRVTATRGRAQLTWLIGGSAAMGIGIWAMHYIGMLAFRCPPRGNTIGLLFCFRSWWGSFVLLSPWWS